MEEIQFKLERPAERKTVGYKSWKKKYRKMRIVFDRKMQSGEELHKQEAKTATTVKRLAVENEYVTASSLSVDALLTQPSLVASSISSSTSTTLPRSLSTSA